MKNPKKGINLEIKVPIINHKSDIHKASLNFALFFPTVLLPTIQSANATIKNLIKNRIVHSINLGEIII